MTLPTRALPSPAELALRCLAALGWATVLCLSLVQGTRLWLPPALQTAGHAAYRLAFWITAPAEKLILNCYPLMDHDVPARHAPLSALATALAAWLLAEALLRLRRSPPGSPTAKGPTRRDALGTLARGGVGLVGSTALGISGWGVLVEPSSLALREYTVPIRGLPGWAQGLRIAQLSDTHYGPYTPLPHLQRAVGMANQLRADLVVLTGDYVHRTPASIRHGIGVLCQLQARLGVYAVLGNHDHWEGAEACRQIFTSGGVRMLDRQHLLLGPDGPGSAALGQALCLAGLGDLWEDEHPPAEALRGVPSGAPRLLLSHNPDYAEKLPEDLRVDLMISGHTHGGQVRVPVLGAPKIPSRYGQKYAGGLCRGPRCPVLVSRGVGMAYLPVRLGVPPEIGLITLVRA